MKRYLVSLRLYLYNKSRFLARSSIFTLNFNRYGLIFTRWFFDEEDQEKKKKERSSRDLPNNSRVEIELGVGQGCERPEFGILQLK